MPGPEECFESKQALNARFRESNRNISPIEKDYHTNLKECKNDILFIAYHQSYKKIPVHTKFINGCKLDTFPSLAIVLGFILSGYFTAIDRFWEDPKTNPFSKSVYEKTRNKFIFS